VPAAQIYVEDVLNAQVKLVTKFLLLVTSFGRRYVGKHVNVAEKFLSAVRKRSKKMERKV